MLTALFGDSPRVRLLDFLADHVDFDYTLTQMHRYARVSRPTAYRLVAALSKEGLLVRTREVGGSAFYRLATEHPKVVAILQMDFRQINDELAADHFGSAPETRRQRPARASSRVRAPPRARAIPAPR